MSIVSIERQMEAMRRTWPHLRGRKINPRTAVWRGHLRPSFESFLVRISYRVPLDEALFDPIKDQPVVNVLNPSLIRKRGNAEGEIPHVYGVNSPRPDLCLFDPETEEWRPGMLIAETTVPWTIEWLAFYEFWTVTGTWAGGGRHPERGERPRRYS